MTSINEARSASLTTFALGAGAVIAQSVLLREAMAAMGGTEMAWGLVMALWLAGVGGGARLGVRIGSTRSAEWMAPAATVLAGAGAVLFRAAPAVLGTTSGESLTTWHAVWLWSAAVVPCAFCAGLAFPVLAAALGSGGAGRAYSLEAAGGLAGGVVFSFVLAPHGTVTTLAVALAALIVMRLWPLHPPAALAAAVVIVMSAQLSTTALAEAGWRWAGRPGALARHAETRHQRIEASGDDPIAVYVAGRLAASYPDPYSTEPRAHLMMLLHPAPRRVLAVGATLDGTVEALASHDLDRLIVVEDDPRIIPLLLTWYGGTFASALEEPSVRTPGGGPLRAIRPGQELDLVLLLDPDPATLRGNRTRTVEFFRKCRSALAPGGMLVVQVGISDTYLGGEAGRLLGITAATLGEVFPRLLAVPGEKILLIAGGADAAMTTKISDLDRRRAARADTVTSLPAAMLPVLVDPTRQAALNTWLDSMMAEVNTVSRPRAVAPAMALHEVRTHPAAARLISDAGECGRPALIIVFIAVLLTIVAAAPLKTRQRVAVAWVVGATSMGWWLLLLAAWQATRGSVYAEIGLLTGLFMAGVAAGGIFGLKLDNRQGSLPAVTMLGVGLSAAIGAGLPIAAPLPFVPALLLVGGVLTGTAFPLLSSCADRNGVRRGAGIVFAADEVGAAAAALTVGTVAIPWVGVTTTAMALAALGAAATVVSTLIRPTHG